MNDIRDLFTALFIWPDQVATAVASLRDDHFPMEDDRALFRAIIAVSQSGAALDSNHAIDALMADGMKEERAGQIVSQALDGAPVQVNIPRYIAKIKDEARKKRLAMLMENVKLRAEAGEDPDAVSEDAMTGIWEIQDDRPTETVVAAKDACKDFLEQAFLERNSPEELIGISTSIPQLDMITTGIRPGEFWVVGALAGKGKTSFALQMAAQAVNDGNPTLVFSLEMTRQEVIRRITGMGVGTQAARNTRSISESSWNSLVECVGDISGLPLYIDDTGSMSALDIASRARTQIRKHGIKLIVVDYLQLVRGHGKELREKVGGVANNLRELAKQTGVPVIALSQLSRPQKLNDRPTMITLKESGDIEAHAHTVLLIYHPTGDDDQPLGEDEIIVGKQRNGPVGSILVYFDSKTLTFRPRTKLEN